MTAEIICVGTELLLGNIVNTNAAYLAEKLAGAGLDCYYQTVVGDNVEITVLNTDPPEGNIDRILERKSELIRPAVANIDQALVVFAIQDPEPNLNLLDRFLVMMETSGIPVTIAFNKIDLADEAMMDRYRKIYEPAGYPVMFLSTYEDSGIHQIR